MRVLYNIKPKYSIITQGSIITGCVATNYVDCKVWGCVITARCDLDKKKVKNVHYLPIVNFDDFLRKEIADDYKNKWSKALKENLGNRLKDKGVSPSFLDRQLSREDFVTLIRANFKKTKEADKFIEDYDKWLNVPNTSLTDIVSDKKGEGLLKQEIDLLINNDNSNYYLIEDWKLDDKKPGFKVVLLREIKEISINCAMQLPDGLLEEDLTPDFWLNNNLAISSQKTNIYYVDSEMSSPFIEHVIQRFSNNFIKIGVEDLPKAEVSKQLLEYSKQILI